MIERIRAPCIKVLHIPAESVTNDEVGQELRAQLRLLSGKAMAVLLDTKTTHSGRGGTGEAFDWSVVSRLEGIPVLLAGGLSKDNVHDAAKMQGVMGVDVASGIEIAGAPGSKDYDLMAHFIKNAKKPTA